MKFLMFYQFISSCNRCLFALKRNEGTTGKQTKHILLITVHETVPFNHAAQAELGAVCVPRALPEPHDTSELK